MSTSLVVPQTEYLQPAALALPEGLSFEEWQDVGRFLEQTNGAVQWWLGDWLNYGEAAYGEKYAQALDAERWEYGALRNMAYVAGRVEMSRRRDNLSFSHHAEVASLDPDVQDRLLGAAAEKGLTRQGLRDAVRTYKQALAAPNGSKPHTNGKKPPAKKPRKEPESAQAIVEALFQGKRRPTDPDPVPDPGQDLLVEYEHEVRENKRLRELVDQLSKGKAEQELAKLSDKYGRLEGRLQQEMTTRAEAEKDAKYAKGQLAKIRKALGVVADREILDAIKDLKR